MASSTREGVNPLRPYYIPPTIGDQTIASNATKNAAAPDAGRYASKARDILADIDYNDYVGDASPSSVQSAKQFIDDLMWKYTSVFMAQPFEVAKTILQVRRQDDIGGLNKNLAMDTSRMDSSRTLSLSSPSPQATMFPEFPESDSDPDEPAYFTPNTPMTPTPAGRSSRRHRPSSPPESPKIPPHADSSNPGVIDIRRPDSLFDVIAQLWSRESAWGVWKGTNTTFLYTVLQSLLENWSRSLLSALLNVPDLGVKDDVDRLVDVASPYPWVSLCVAAAASVATGLMLAPLDLVRTRLVVNTLSKAPRRTLRSLRSLPSYFCPAPLVGPTVLHSLVHPFLTLSTPMVLRSQFLIDSELSPMTFSVAKFCTSCVSLFVKLPLETVLRRAQMTVLTSDPGYTQALDKSEGRFEPVVPLGEYKGVLGTMYSIVTEEGSRAVPTGKPARGSALQRTRKGGAGKKSASEVVYRKGQGVEGLWRGWKVSWWGLMGLWVAGIAGNGGEGEF